MQGCFLKTWFGVMFYSSDWSLGFEVSKAAALGRSWESAKVSTRQFSGRDKSSGRTWSLWARTSMFSIDGLGAFG